MLRYIILQNRGKLMIIIKKRNKITKEEFNRVPYELKSLMYFNSNYDNDYKKLELFLNKMY